MNQNERKRLVSLLIIVIALVLVLIVVFVVIYFVNKQRSDGRRRGNGGFKSSPSSSIEGIPPNKSKDIEGDYLYAWTGSEDKTNPDFIAVIDARPDSHLYGQVISTAQIPATDTFPHHMEMSVHHDNQFFANSFMANRNWRFDFRDPARPSFENEAQSLSDNGFGFAHSFARLPDGKVVSSVQMGPGGQGGIAVFDPDTGDIIKTVSSADPNRPDLKIMTYGIEPIPEKNLVVTSSFNMNMKDPVQPVIQIYDMNSLQLIKSFVTNEEGVIDNCSSVKPSMKESQLTFEIRKFVSPKKIGAVVNTYNCGYFFLDLTNYPETQPVLHRSCPISEKDGCAVPALAKGRFLVMPIENDHSLTVMDLYPDPLSPKKVDRFYFDPRYFGHYWPHWATYDAKRSRIATSDFTDPEKSKPDGTIYLFHLNPKNGKLTLDQNFKSNDSQNPGVRFRKLNKWPHGETGPAIPHGIAFSHPRLNCGNPECGCGINCTCPPPCKCTSKQRCC